MSFVERLVAAVLLVVCAAPLPAADFVLVVRDPVGVGFNDSRPADPAAGDNGATTLGEQRLRAVRRAAEIWGGLLDSAVPIRIELRMPEQDCGDDGTTLASAGPITLAAGFANAPRANTSYPVALANALAGRDLDGGNDIRANFNVRIDHGCHANTSGWWYGVDPDEPVPADRIAMLPVALHELAHGLGFTASVDLQTGAWPGGVATVWTNHLYDLGRMSHWRTMTAAQRVASATGDPDLVWTGGHVNGRLSQILSGAPVLVVEGAPRAEVVVDGFSLAEFGPGWTDAPLSASVVRVNDGVGAPFDGCQTPFRNGDRLAGRIAMIDRGECTFVEKVANAQAHGAVAVVIVDNQPGELPGMGGTDPSIAIPAVMVTREVGAAMARALNRPRLWLRFDQSDELAGTAQGCLRMYAPPTLQTGSSVSHFHRLAQPNLLMEPSLTRLAFDQVDLTLDLFRDLGWPVSGAAPPAADQCAISPLP